MEGNIYTDERCPKCNGVMRHDANRDGCFCKEHPNIKATTRFWVRFPGGIKRRFRNDFAVAQQFLNGLRYEKAKQGAAFDPRLHLASAPLGFTNLSRKYLDTKQVSTGHKRNLKNYFKRAQSVWGNTCVTDISYGHIEDFLLSLDVSGKTRNEYCTALRTFWAWVEKREGKKPPEFPKIDYTLGMRTIVDQDTQAVIIDKVREMAPVKVWLAIKWLSTYISIRPGELVELREKDINVGGFFILRPETVKTKEPKFVPMLESDIELFQSFPTGMPDLHFFRWEKSARRYSGNQIKVRVLRDWWKKACAEVGIDDVDLYGGTRHSTTTAISQHFTKEELRTNGTMHGTNKAFERYMQADAIPTKSIYQRIEDDRKKKAGAGQVIPLKKVGTD